MSSRKKVARGMGLAISAATTIIALSSQVSAADLNSYFTGGGPAAAPVQPVEFGTGWYLRGDVAYARNSVPQVNAYGLFPNTSDLRNNYSVGLGAGYKFTNWFRTDATFDYRGSVSGYDPTTTYNAFGDRWDALANGYIDLGSFIGNWNGVSPYIGAGVGAAWGRTKMTTASPLDPCTQNGTVQCYATHMPISLAWALMAGVAIEVYPHAFLDLGYRYINMGTYSFYDSSIASSITVPGYSSTVQSYAHEFRVGFRYMID